MPDLHTLVTRTVATAAQTVACQTTASIGSDVAAEETSSTGAGADQGADAGSSGSSGVDDGPGQSGPNTSTASTTDASTTDATTGASPSTGGADSDPTFTGGGTGGLCEPAPGEHPCVRCAKRNCCFETNACLGYPACECLLTCIDGNQQPWQCPQMCPYSPEGMDLFGCVGFLCQQECG